MPIFGYLSREWLFVVACIMIFATVFHRSAFVWQTDYLHFSRAAYWAIGSYLFLLLAGRTPEGIDVANSSACKGHPVLSLCVVLVVFVLWLI